MRKRIPTLLVLILFIAVIGLGLFILFYNKNKQIDQLNAISPQQLTVANLTDISATVIWQTKKPVIAKVLINNSSYADDRDQNNKPIPRHTHFVTIQNLAPETNYQFIIEMDGINYPENPVPFKTISRALNEKALAEQISQPIRGTLIQNNQQPVTEALIVLKLPDTITKATYITDNGNYLLPLNRLISTNLIDTIVLNNNQPITLEARSSDLVSLIQLTVPAKNQIPPVILGKNESFIDFLAQPAGTPAPLEITNPQTSYDLNNDGKVNTLDSSLVSDLISRKQFNPKADFNNDQTIDDKDLDLMKTKLK